MFLNLGIESTFARAGKPPRRTERLRRAFTVHDLPPLALHFRHLVAHGPRVVFLMLPCARLPIAELPYPYVTPVIRTSESVLQQHHAPRPPARIFAMHTSAHVGELSMIWPAAGFGGRSAQSLLHIVLPFQCGHERNRLLYLSHRIRDAVRACRQEPRPS